ncbi:hypothetical protein SG34_032800 [Thalassomonas viridans]|uniref:histidine kinase n=1 Tax=Thalassomonas viridans TaxID=137584 RepID=A0AAE9Z9E9_9GAMM|nr:two-component regulator propeller domain-containing protein [Thalassomonas viridans]WDE08692.1 hypothetical protein SG34_032800 [Thalassomonas viridans]
MKFFYSCAVFLFHLLYSCCSQAAFNKDLFAPIIYSVDANSRLENKEVREIAQDEAGFLWVGTRGGLFRYDGYEYQKVDSPDNSVDFSNIYVRSMLVDKNVLWVGTMSDGLFQLDLTTYEIKHYRHDNQQLGSISGNQVNDLALDKDGNLWVGTSFGLDLFKRKEQTFLHYRSSEDSKERYFNYLLDIEFDHENTLWLATGKGLAKFDEKTLSFHRVFINDAVGDNHGAKQQHLQGVTVRTIHIADDGRMWLATQKQGTYVVSIEDGHILRLPMEDAAKGKINTVIAQPNKNEIWISGADGVEIRDAATGAILKVLHANRLDAYGLNSKTVFAMSVSKSGLLWLGVSGFGLQYYNPNNNAIKRFDTYSPTLQAVFSRVIDNVIKLSEDKILLFSGGQPEQLNLQTGEVITLKLPFSSNRGNIVSALQLDENNLLLGSESGEIIHYHFPSGTSQRFPLPVVAIKNETVRHMVQGKPGQVWVTLDNHLFRLDLKTMVFEQIMDSQGKPFLNFIQYLMFDKQGRLWVGTPSGVGVIEQDSSHVDMYNTWKGTAGTLSDNYVTQIVENYQGEILLNTRAGLDKLIDKTEGEMRFVPFAEGLHKKSKNEEKLLPLPDGTYWFGAYFKLDPQGNLLAEYDISDGVLVEGPSRATLLLNQKYILNVSSFGISIIDPAKLHHWNLKPPIVISELAIGNKQSSLSLNGKAIYLSPDDNKFSLRFTALDLSSPEDNRYRYKLEGYEDTWNETPSDIRQATYTSLPPGTYQLLLDGTNREGQWSESPLKVEVIVEPKIYQTLWFQLLTILIFCCFLYLFINWRIRIAKSIERQVYERKEAIQRAKMMDALMEKKNQLLADVSHELRTPLTALQLRIEALQHKMEEDVEASYDGLMKKVTDINHLIHDIYQLSKSDIGTLSFELKPYSCVELLNEVAEELAGFAHLHGFKWQQHIAVSPLLQLKVDKEKFTQVLHNLTNNSVAYTDAPGTIALTVEVKGEYLNVVIEDSSPGVAEQDMPKIFERFYRVESSRSRATGGSGLGLAICKSIIEAFQGSIDSSNSPLGGLAVEIKLPISEVK